ncbi:MAG TPA: hypothetical protein VFE32_14615 [Puia sp.]|nr:hypothetical protein [Puia sp.]
MGKLSNIGRIFYGISIAALGLLTIFYHDFPYMLIPPKHSWLTDHVILVYIAGALLFVAGACIVFQIKPLSVSLLLGVILLLIFCFYFIPYELLVSTNHMHFGDWENAAKELTFAGGAFVIADSYSKQNEKSFIPSLSKLMPLGIIIYSLTIISYGADHFLYAKQAVGYMPSWVTHKLFWMYLTGSALLASGIAILLRIKFRLAAALLGTMIFIWVVILHIPKVIAAHGADDGGEVTSAFLALAYCGIAFVIAGKTPKHSPAGGS